MMLKEGAEAGCKALRDNLDAPQYGTAPDAPAALCEGKHLLTEREGWQPPAPELVNTWFTHFQTCFPEYGSDNKLAALLGLNGNNAGRRIRAYCAGETAIPYGIWRRFLVFTGRVSQEIIPVLGIFDMQQSD
nr:hypothetical protein [Scandinavium goeteborgense]